MILYGKHQRSLRLYSLVLIRKKKTENVVQVSHQELSLERNAEEVCKFHGGY